MLVFGRFQTFVLMTAYLSESDYTDNISLQKDYPINCKYAILRKKEMAKRAQINEQLIKVERRIRNKLSHHTLRWCRDNVL